VTFLHKQTVSILLFIVSIRKCVYSFKHESETSNKKPGKPPYNGESRNLKIRIKESEAI
jgi:hypothetical protein